MFEFVSRVDDKFLNDAWNAQSDIFERGDLGGKWCSMETPKMIVADKAINPAAHRTLGVGDRVC